MRFASFPMSQRGAFNMGCLLAVIVVLVAAGVGVFYYFKAATEAFSQAVKLAVEDNPVILEHIGEIRGIEMDLGGTQDSVKEQRFAFLIQGSKGAGKLTAGIRVAPEDERIEGQPDLPEVVSGTLAVNGGETYDLFPEAQPETVPDEVVPVPAGGG